MKRKIIDRTIEEVYRTRREISNRFGGDIFAISEDAARRQVVSNRPVWTPPKHREQTHPTKSPTGLLSGRESSTAAR